MTVHPTIPWANVAASATTIPAIDSRFPKRAVFGGYTVTERMLAMFKPRAAVAPVEKKDA